MYSKKSLVASLFIEVPLDDGDLQVEEALTLNVFVNQGMISKVGREMTGLYLWDCIVCRHRYPIALATEISRLPIRGSVS